METFLAGFGDVFEIKTLLFIALGVTLGYVVGALPGLGKGTATAVAIPLTFYISPLPAIAFLIGISKGSAAGSAVSAILLNTPGEPSSAPTAFDGYPLAVAGKAQKALKMGLFASVCGDLVSTMVLIALAQPLAEFALAIGPVEIAAVLFFALVFIAGLSGSSLSKGIIAGTIGLLAASVGTELETATPRMTFEVLELYDGLPIVPVAIGMLAVSEMIVQIGINFKPTRTASLLDRATRREDRIVTWPEWKLCIPTMLRGSAIGTVVGILPGLGATVASFLSYATARRYAKDPDRFGKGALEGVAAAESADNAVMPASLVPLFALGIPGSVIAAILIGAFMIQGLTPGPLMFVEQPRLVFGIYSSMICASVFLLFIGYFGQRAWAWVITVSPSIILTCVVYFCAVGAYLQGGGVFGVGMMLFFGVLGYFAKKLDYSFVTFLIGFIVGPAFELALRQSIGMTDHSLAGLLDHPVAIAFIVLTLLSAWRISVHHRKKIAAASEAPA